MVSLEQLNREIKVSNARIAEFTKELNSKNPAARVDARKQIDYYYTMWKTAVFERKEYYGK